MKAGDFSIALRIRHPSLDPRELTTHIGFEPQHSWRAGEPRRSVSGAVAEGAYRETYWVGLVPTVWTPVHEHAQDPQTMSLTFTLLRMKRDGTFWKRVADEGGSVECQIRIHGADSVALDLSQPLLSLLAHLKIGLSVEVDAARRAAAA